MKLIISLLICLFGLLNVRTRQILKRDHGYDQKNAQDEIKWQCAEEINLNAKCPADEFPLVKAFSSIRSEEGLQKFVKATNPQELCDGTISYLNCTLSTLMGLSVDCQPIVFDQTSLMTYHRAVDFAQGLMRATANICNNSLTFIEENWSCFEALALRHHSEIGRCSVITHPCYDVDSNIYCVQSVIRTAQPCSEGVAEFAAQLMRQIRAAAHPLCSDSASAGRSELLNRFY